MVSVTSITLLHLPDSSHVNVQKRVVMTTITDVTLTPLDLLGLFHFPLLDRCACKKNV